MTRPKTRTVDEIAAAVEAGQLKATDMAEAALRAIGNRDADINAVACPLDALARQAAENVETRRREGRALGPLAGVPITIKECFHLAGTPNTLGRRGQSEVRAVRTSPLVERLLAAGAIPVAKTNLAQLMLMHETDNPLYGRTNNPWDLERSPGGSGGGDAAAIAAGFAAASLGTDIGGSIRQPAHSCGVVGFKPTDGRLPTAGVEGFMQDIGALKLQAGPLATSVSGIRTMMSVLSTPTPRERGDHGTPPWRESHKDAASLRVGYWEDEEYFAACPTARRAVRQSVQMLRDAGATVIPIMPPDMRQATHLYYGLFGADGGERIRDELRGEQVDSRIGRLLRLGRIPRWGRKLLAKVVQWLGDPHLAGILQSSARLSVSEFWNLVKQLAAFREEFLGRMRGMSLDAVLLPPHATVAIRHGQSDKLLPAASYCFLANLLGAPAGVVPVTRVRADEQTDEQDEANRRRSPSVRAAAVNGSGSAGLPCGVQVMGAPWNDELVLDVMTVIESAARGNSDFPRLPSIQAVAQSDEEPSTLAMA